MRVADSISKNSRYLAKSDAGISNMFVASTKLMNMGFRILYLKSPENLPKLRTVPVLMYLNGLRAFRNFGRE